MRQKCNPIWDVYLAPSPPPTLKPNKGFLFTKTEAHNYFEVCVRRGQETVSIVPSWRPCSGDYNTLRAQSSDDEDVDAADGGDNCDTGDGGDDDRIIDADISFK